jgi:hypothetical protein
LPATIPPTIDHRSRPDARRARTFRPRDDCQLVLSAASSRRARDGRCASLLDRQHRKQAPHLCAGRREEPLTRYTPAPPPGEGASKGADSDAWLWSPPAGTAGAPPAVAELESLPLQTLSPRDAERLFLCLLESVADVSYAKSYGTPGQPQQGIDVYGRLRPTTPAAADGQDQQRDVTASLLPSRRYVTLQSKRVEIVRPGDLATAVTKLLDGIWADQCSQFYYATTFDFRDTNLDQAVREQADRLQARGIELILWDAEQVNEMLRDRPRLVARFFSPAWVKPFCGENSLAALPAAKLDAADSRRLRAELRGLYAAAFVAVASLRPPGTVNQPFVMLDALPRPENTMDGWGNADLPVEASEQGPAAAGASEPDIYAPWAVRRPRRSLRPVRALIDDRHGPSQVGDALPADDWIAGGTRNLLVGAPGAGKSSLLRFIATDLLADEPASFALQRAHGDRLPVWLPFGFLCHHLDASDSNSLTSAVEAWLASHARPDLYPLVAKALEDDRLLLLIDGIDEWTSQATAGKALARLETFLGSTDGTVIVTSRPYALARLPLNLMWRTADVAPLSADQQRRVAQQYLVPALHEGPDLPAQAAMWLQSNVEPFIAQLTAIPELRALARTPLLLALLARSWQGEPLPGKRFDLYNLIIRMLIETHPKMRARASSASAGPLSASEFLTLIRAVAYRLKVSEAPQPVPSRTMQKLIENVLADEDLLGYDKNDARTMAAQAMAMAEDEFGLLVPQGAKHVGFIHRVIGDHLAGCHLADQEHKDQLAAFTARHGDAAWTDALLAALNTQPNKHMVAHLLDAVAVRAETPSAAPWPQDVQAAHASMRFLAAALASDVNLSPRRSRELLDLLVSEVETSPFLAYRATLVTALAAAAATASNWRHLEPVFRRWLDATRPDPAAALRALDELPEDLDSRIRRILLQSMRHEDGAVRSRAVDVFVHRYSNSGVPDPARAPHDTWPPDDELLEILNKGPDARTQAAALMALFEGWPHDPATREAVEWARRAPKSNLRTAALFAVARADAHTRLDNLLTPDERLFVMAYLYQEGSAPYDHDWTGMNAALVTRAVAEASDGKKEQLAAYAATTLRQNPLGEGNRHMCWQLACGPLSTYEVLRDWVIEELNKAEDTRPLILYDLSQMPNSWLDHQPMKDALDRRADDLLNMSWHRNDDLTRALPDDKARAALLKALARHRPASAARELVRRFGRDPVVIDELNRRFADDTTAAVLSDLAIDHLGPVVGFTRIHDLLATFNTQNPTTAAEAHVVIASAVARSWGLLREAVAGTATGSTLDPELARKVIAAYDDKEVAAACMAVPTERGLGWHIAETIQTWPSHTIDYALTALRSSAHITNGLEDPIHSAALRAHAAQPSPRSREVLDLALALLNPLPAELREVLAHELARAPIPPPQLVDVTSAWKNDPDAGVRRTTAVGITQTILRHHQPGAPPSAELTAWRNTVRLDLVAYGPQLEEDRQIAWTCMLLLRAPELLAGQLESIGEATPPGVRLADIYGNPDDLLVELVGRNWQDLLPHLKPDPLRRLAGARSASQATETEALRHLIGAATKAPAIADLVQQRIAAEERDGAASPSRELLEATPGGIDYLIDVQGRTAANLSRVINASVRDPASRGDHRGARERWAFTRLTEPWDMPDSQRQAILWDAAGRHAPMRPRDDDERRGQGSVVRAAADFLHPHSEQAQHRLQQLTDLFARPAPARELGRAATWIEALVLTFMSTPADHLPLLIDRVFHPRRLEAADEPLWKFTTPLVQRLATDAAALPVLLGALDGTPPPAASPLFSTPEPAPREAQADSVRRVFLLARVLHGTGQLTPELLAVALETLSRADRRTVVADPFTGATGPLYNLGVTLSDGPQS